jgi:hypothetical protein
MVRGGSKRNLVSSQQVFPAVKVGYDSIFGLQPRSNTLPAPIPMLMTYQRTAPYLCLIANRKLSRAPAHVVTGLCMSSQGSDSV